MITSIRRLLMRAEIPAALEVSGCMMTDAGYVRESNEDRAAYVLPRQPDPRIGRGVLALVADGMGGHAAGEVASGMSAEIVLRDYYAGNARDSHNALRMAFQAANRAIYAAAQRDPACSGMGTTCTALAITDGWAYAAHIGDSRLYLLRQGALRQLTEDDSLVSALVRSGQLSKQQARSHGSRNVILRALGRQPKAEISVLRKPLRVAAGDRFLICSDGLTDLVPDEEIAAVLLAAEPDAACRELLACALKAGGSDNVTAGVFAVRHPRAGSCAGSAATRATRTHQPAEALS